jgi:hypothetical protein
MVWPFLIIGLGALGSLGTSPGASPGDVGISFNSGSHCARSWWNETARSLTNCVIFEVDGIPANRALQHICLCGRNGVFANGRKVEEIQTWRNMEPLWKHGAKLASFATWKWFHLLQSQ